MNTRTQVSIDPETQRRAQERAAELGISFAQYIRQLLSNDLGELKRRVDVSLIFDLVDEGPATDVARNRDKMIADAIWQDHVRVTVRKGRTRDKTSGR
jgi:hypothetical protein